MPKGKMIKIAPPALLDRRKCKIYYVYKLFQLVQTHTQTHILTKNTLTTASSVLKDREEYGS